VKVAILGAGVTGITTAYYLAKEGCKVTVFDRASRAADETSFANGGQISISQPFPWSSPDLPLKMLKWFGRKDAPLVVRLQNDPHMWAWTLRFLLSARPSVYYKNAAKVIRLALHSKTCLDIVAQDEGLDYHRQTRGILKLFNDAASAKEATKQQIWLREHGLEQQLLSPADCVTIEPALRQGTSKFIGGTHCALDESGDAHLFAGQLEQAARKLGVLFKYDHTITGLETNGSEVISVTVNGKVKKFDKYVLSSGSYSALFAKQININLPVYPVKGYSVSLPITTPDAAPQVSITDISQHVVISRLGDVLRAAGTAEICGYDLSANKTREDMVLNSVSGLFPGAGDTAQAERWCGLRPMAADGVPVIGGSRYSNFYLNTGHGHLGWTLCCGSAQLLAAAMTGKSTELDIGAYSIKRFQAHK